ncbi:hypothetical protein XENOCAPTIV_023493 [Xenoophorus captivus]|uniref:Uncharacterized protein n=1 Tax=Xenoophorus captivus TaxID=1517983 RepID=A0ABV0QE66_9TELE
MMVYVNNRCCFLLSAAEREFYLSPGLHFVLIVPTQEIQNYCIMKKTLQIEVSLLNSSRSGLLFGNQANYNTSQCYSTAFSLFQRASPFCGSICTVLPAAKPSLSIFQTHSACNLCTVYNM